MGVVSDSKKERVSLQAMRRSQEPRLVVGYECGLSFWEVVIADGQG